MKNYEKLLVILDANDKRTCDIIMVIYKNNILLRNHEFFEVFYTNDDIDLQNIQLIGPGFTIKYVNEDFVFDCSDVYTEVSTVKEISKMICNNKEEAKEKYEEGAKYKLKQLTGMIKNADYIDGSIDFDGKNILSELVDSFGITCRQCTDAIKDLFATPQIYPDSIRCFRDIISYFAEKGRRDCVNQCYKIIISIIEESINVEILDNCIEVFEAENPDYSYQFTLKDENWIRKFIATNKSEQWLTNTLLRIVQDSTNRPGRNKILEIITGLV